MYMIATKNTEKEGFEPSHRFHRPTPFPGEPLQPLGYFSKKRKGWDSNPRLLSKTPVFKTGSLNHSDTPPKKTYKLDYKIKKTICQDIIKFFFHGKNIL